MQANSRFRFHLIVYSTQFIVCPTHRVSKVSQDHGFNDRAEIDPEFIKNLSNYAEFDDCRLN